MSVAEDMTITLRLNDEVTPKLKAIQRRVWWMEHGEDVMRAITALLVVSAFILGRITT